MARIRTLKPDFFTSADIVAQPPLGRLLYQGLWCEADRQGRLVWNPASWKLRYLPGDECDIETLAAGLLDRRLVVRYGDDYAYIPTFAKHQHINNRELESVLPDPHASTTREARVIDASTTREARDGHAASRKEKEGEGRRRKEKERNVKEDTNTAERGEQRAPRGSRLPSDWVLSNDLRDWTAAERPDMDADRMLAEFRDYWIAKPGQDGVKLDWPATWRNWVRHERGHPARNGHAPATGETAYQRSMRERVESIAPSIAAKAPGKRAVIDVEAKNVIVPGRLG